MFDAPAHLVANRYRVVTKEELAREVWDGSSVSDDNGNETEGALAVSFDDHQMR